MFPSGAAQKKGIVGVGGGAGQMAGFLRVTVRALCSIQNVLYN